MRKIVQFSAVLMAIFLAASSSLSAANQKDDPFEWTNGYSLILTSGLTEDQAQATVDFITDNGGQVAIVVSPRMLLGWANGSLVGQHGILAVHNRPVPPGVLKNMNVDEVDHVGFFNQVASGKWKAEKAATYAPMQWTGPVDLVRRPDRRVNDLLPSETIAQLGTTSDFMAGKVKYNVFFVESTSENYYSWSCADLSTAVSEIAAGLSFWSSKASTYGVPLSFVTAYNRPPAPGCAGTIKVQQAYEPVLHPGACVACDGYDGDALWVNPIMCNFGYCSGTCWQRVDAYNAAIRTTSKTNWATSLFMAYNPSPAPTTFTNGYFAYAWGANGPYTQLLFRNNGWNISDIDRITSHETGHLFGAFDEYAASGCSNCSTSDAGAKNVINGNCENCNAGSMNCMMKGNSLALCGYTPGQLGWGLNVNAVKVVSSSLQEKTNWLPGQTVNYFFGVTIPGKADECVNVRSRWYRQFQNNVTESDIFDQPCLVKTGTTAGIWLPGKVIPANAGPGEALLEVQLEFYYGSGTYFYGRGIRATTRGKFFVLPATANPTVAAPVRYSEPSVVPQ